MMSLGMDLIATDPNLPVTIMWVCRTVQEFEIFSTTLYNAKNRYRNLTVKVWITLSLPEPKISKETVNELETDEEKCELVISLLKPPMMMNEKKLFNDRHRDDAQNQNHLFTKTSPGLESLGNATAMLIAMIFALTGYTTAVDFSRDREIENEGVWTLINIAFIMGMILLTFVIILLARPLLRSNKKRQFEIVFHQNHSPDDDDDCDSSDAEIDLSMESGSGGVDMDAYKTMLEGRIGCRPDMEAEFRELAFAHQRDKEIGFDTVGVLACGPKAMTNAINLAVHNAGPLSTFFDAGRIENKDGSDATFAFVEEDWEW